MACVSQRWELCGNIFIIQIVASNSCVFLYCDIFQEIPVVTVNKGWALENGCQFSPKSNYFTQRPHGISCDNHRFPNLKPLTLAFCKGKSAFYQFLSLRIPPVNSSIQPSKNSTFAFQLLTLCYETGTSKDPGWKIHLTKWDHSIDPILVTTLILLSLILSASRCTNVHCD